MKVFTLSVLVLATAAGCLSPMFGGSSMPVAYIVGPSTILEWTNNGETILYQPKGSELVKVWTKPGYWLDAGGKKLKVTWPKSVPQSRANICGIAPDNRIVALLKEKEYDDGALSVLHSNGQVVQLPANINGKNLLSAAMVGNDEYFIYPDRMEVWTSGKRRTVKLVPRVPGYEHKSIVSEQKNLVCVASDEKAIVYNLSGHKVASWPLRGKPNFLGFSKRHNGFYAVNNGGVAQLDHGVTFSPPGEITVLRSGVTQDLSFGIGRGYALEPISFKLGEK